MNNEDTRRAEGAAAVTAPKPAFLQLNVERPYGEPGTYIGDERTTLVAKLYAGQEHYAKLFAAAPRLLANLKMMTDLAEAYGVGNDCDGNIIEARELIAEVEGAK